MNYISKFCILNFFTVSVDLSALYVYVKTAPSILEPFAYVLYKIHKNVHIKSDIRIYFVF